MQQNSSKTKVIILGSTGSIGTQALDVVRTYNNKFKVVGLSCNNSVNQIIKQAEEFFPEAIAITSADQEIPDSRYIPKVYYSETGIFKIITEIDADIVVNGISGAKGLMPSIKVLESRKNLALANKETIVMAGNLVLNLANRKKVKIIPIDSEHSAIFHLIQNVPISHIDEIILTASGGPFWNWEEKELQNVTVKDALKHPNWEMGKKITIDSATMANKGLEIIEAQLLFNFDISKIKVVLHPQSIVHSMVKTIDGCLYAQMSKPDMRIPIQNALTYPEILPNPYSKFDITDKVLSFLPVDLKKYKMLDIAYTVAKAGGIYPIIYNAANEVAVDAFLKYQVSFLQIPELVQSILDFEWKNPVATIEDILYIDKEVRIKTKCIIDYKYSI